MRRVDSHRGDASCLTALAYSKLATIGTICQITLTLQTDPLPKFLHHRMCSITYPLLATLSVAPTPHPPARWPSPPSPPSRPGSRTRRRRRGGGRRHHPPSLAGA